MFEYQSWLPILSVLIAAYTAFLQRKHIMMATEPVALNGARAVPLLVWWKSPAVILLFALAGVSWGPFIISKWNEDDRICGITAGIRTATVDNMTGKLVDLKLLVSFDGSEIERYSPRRVMAVAFVWIPDKDYDDVQELQRSPIFDIKKEKMDFLFG